MIRFFKNLFKGKDPGPVVEPTKVDVANAAPYKIEAPVPVAEKPNVVAKVAVQQAKKKRTFVKREDSGVAKVAPVKAKPKAPAKPRAPAKPKAK
jgi:hypothetical protein